MRTRRLLPLAVLALLVPAFRVFAGDATGPTPRDGIVLRRAEAAPKAPGAIGTESANAVFSYSVELPEVARLQGAGAFYRTAVDITNHSDNGGVDRDGPVLLQLHGVLRPPPSSARLRSSSSSRRGTACTSTTWCRSSMTADS